MKYLVEAGTDGGSLLFFDPGALPEDFDTQSQGNEAEVLEKLMVAGKACWINTDGDGGFLLHAYVDEPVPQSLEPFARDPFDHESFAVPTGALYLIGAEYCSRSEDKLRQYPHMGGSFPVRPGVYRLTLWRMEYPKGLQEELLRQQVSAMAFWCHQHLMGALVGLAMLGLVGLCAGVLLAPRHFWLRWLLPLWGFLVLLPFLMVKLEPYRQASERYEVIQRQFPSLVAHLQFRGPA